MTDMLRGIALAATLSLAFIPATFAQDAMATDAMGTDAMAGSAMMSEDDLKLCLEQAAMITFPQVMEAATAACHDLHNGMMGGEAMGTDAMATDAMAPATK